MAVANITTIQSKQMLTPINLPFYLYGQRIVISVLPQRPITSNILTPKYLKDKS